MNRKSLLLFVAVIPVFLLIGVPLSAQDLEVKPVFQVDFKDPTQDKPQSKIWFAAGTWWTILPDSSGPQIWKREEGEWKEEKVLNSQLQSLPGKGDVYSEEENQFLVLVGNCELHFLKLYTTSESIQVESVNSLPIPLDCHQIETATLVKDATGTLWVASDWNERVLVWSSSDQGDSWAPPVLLGDSISTDDISVLSRITGGVSVIWSNQLEDAVYERIHLDGQENWGSQMTVSQGNKTADDHLNTSVLDDGKLIVASKNSLDQVGMPQFVLRIRELDGEWKDFPYRDLLKDSSPTRPVVTQLPNGAIAEVHTEALADGAAEISVNEVRIVSDQLVDVQEKMRLKSSNGAHLNNVSLDKQDYQAVPNGPWLILFSDRKGNIYEFDLYPLFKD